MISFVWSGESAVRIRFLVWKRTLGSTTPLSVYLKSISIVDVDWDYSIRWIIPPQSLSYLYHQSWLECIRFHSPDKMILVQLNSQLMAVLLSRRWQRQHRLHPAMDWTVMIQLNYSIPRTPPPVSNDSWTKRRFQLVAVSSFDTYLW